MADWYDKTLSKIGKGLLDLDNLSNPKIVPVTSGYVFNQSHEFYSDITPSERVSTAVTMSNVIFGASGVPVNSLDESILAAGPTNFWKLDESSGLVASDTMSNADLIYQVSAGTVGYDVAGFRADGLGRAKDFNDTKNKIIYKADNVTGVPTGQDWSLEFAAIFDTIGSVSNYFTSKAGAAIIANVRTDSKFQVVAIDNGSTSFNAQTDTFASMGIALDGVTPHWVSIIANSTTEIIKMYIDDIERASVSFAAYTGAWGGSTSATGFAVGGRKADASFSAYCEGQMDTVAFYDLALTDEERTRNYDWWSVDSGDGGITGLDGWLDADDPTMLSPTLNDVIEAFVVYNDTGAEATSPIILYTDSGLGLPYSVQTGADIDVQFGANGIAKL